MLVTSTKRLFGATGKGVKLMKTSPLAAAALAAALTMLSWPTPAMAANGWSSSVAFTNQVAGQVVTGGGYPVPAGATAPTPGTCRLGTYNANRSESWIAVKPGTEDLVGTSKIFFEKYSTFYDFHLGGHSFPNGAYAGSSMVTGYDCISTGTQDMPPSWTNNTDPNAAFDTKGRVYQVTLPFNAFWVNLVPNSNIGVVYSDDLGRTWHLGNGGRPIEAAINSSFALGFVEDKQWVAVNHIVGNKYQDHVYAAWTVYNGQTAKINVSVSRDRGQTFTKRATVTRPAATGSLNEYVYPMVDAAGDLYLSIASNSPSGTDKTIYVARSTDDGATFGPWMAATPPIPGFTVTVAPDCCLNGGFRDGILQNFAASPTYPGHLYMTWEQWTNGQADIMFAQSTDAGLTWSSPLQVNDPDANDQFQPSIATGPDGAVAIAFYDRRLNCPSDPSIGSGHAGASNLCIDTTLQAFKDSGGGAVAVGGNLRISQYSWDPTQPLQTVDGLPQVACAGHRTPCNRGFIGDYFGLAISAGNVYAFFVSTHYPSGVSADGGGTVYYQQQVLSTVSRAALGI
jgi:hypothetical protein